MVTAPNETIVDSHHHFWDVDRLEYVWMPPDPSVLRQNYVPETMAPLLERAGVSKTVLVQAHQSIEEAHWLLEIAEEMDFVAGVVAWADLTSPGLGRDLDSIQAKQGLVGIRHQVEEEPDEAWLVRPDVIGGLKEVARHDLVYDLLVKGPHIKYVPEVAEKVPDLRMVVDHIAKPPIAAGQTEPWATHMAAIATIPGIYCKISGMVTEADHMHWTVADLKPYVTHVVELFGFDRLMWGSDWPVCLLASSYAHVLNAALQAVGDLTPEQRTKFLAQNAVDFYRL
jgi:L-fuconolactonase